MNKTILWCQSNSTTGDDILLVDGQPCKAEDRSSIMSFLLKNRKSHKCIHRSGKEHCWYPLISNLNKVVTKCLKNNAVISSNLMCYTDGEGKFLIRARYEERDELGREIVYSFFSNSADIDISIQRLIEISKTLGRTCKLADIELLRKIRHLVDKRRKYGFIISISVVVFLICMTIWYLKSKVM